jgi:hypothetical protein
MQKVLLEWFDPLATSLIQQYHSCFCFKDNSWKNLDEPNKITFLFQKDILPTTQYLTSERAEVAVPWNYSTFTRKLYSLSPSLDDGVDKACFQLWGKCYYEDAWYVFALVDSEWENDASDAYIVCYFHHMLCKEWFLEHFMSLVEETPISPLHSWFTLLWHVKEAQKNREGTHCQQALFQKLSELVS